MSWCFGLVLVLVLGSHSVQADFKFTVKAGDDLDLLIFLHLQPECWDWGFVAWAWFTWGLGDGSQGFANALLDKNPTH